MILSSPAKVVIVDDHPPIRKHIEMLVNQEPGFIVSRSCGSAQEAIQLLQFHHPDIVFLSISLPDGSAFDVLGKFPSFCFKVIFLSESTEHAIPAIKANAIDYLLTPVNPLELKQALKKALHADIIQTRFIYEAIHRSDIAHRIVLRSFEYLQVAEFTEIFYCHSEFGYTTFYLTKDRKVLTSKHLKDYEDLLPPSWFLKPHQSYIVNHQFIERYRKEDGYLILKNGTEIPVALRRREKINEYFNNLL